MQNKFPLWKNSLLIILVILGFIYVLPNLYMEKPVVQVAVPAHITPDIVKEKIQTIFSEAKISYQSLDVTDTDVTASFSSTDTQLLARDALKQSLGSQYTVALNLATSTPKWLHAIGAYPMKQGLDLRGGVHFLLEVDIDAVVTRRYEGMVKNLGQNLREENIRYAGIRYIPNQGIDIRFRSPETLDEAKSDTHQKFPALDVESTPKTLTLHVALTESELSTIRQNTIDQTMTILRNRVNELGVGEAVVQQQGATRIAVDLPGIQDAARAKDILGGTATLQFYLVDFAHDPQAAQQTGAVPVGSKLYKLDGQPILLKRQVVLSGDSITSAVSSFDQQSASPAVEIQLGGGGESFFSKITRDNIGKRMAIVFVETKTVIRNKIKETHRSERVISAPVIQSALGSQFQITGITDIKEAQNLALLLRAGALPAAIYPVEERTVGPSLGKENIERGILSLEVGMGLILILMLVYYRLFGLIANTALLLNIILLCALLSIIGATLTLPGIAGIVLTVGMAVDANVLINERIREELRRGISIQAAIFAGYERAFTTILDANITTFIVAIVLFSIGTGPVRGFAVTLSLGLLTSMLTGVTYTRAMVNAIYGGRQVKRLSIGL
jgi:preprotein translocase subunit SecD